MLELNSVHHLDIFDLCAQLDDHSTDMILCDLPYGTTACAWDTVIPFEPMWAAFKRIIKPKGAIVLTASQPFTSLLICSNMGMFKHTWVWDKAISGNFLNMKIQPAEIHEDICVFSDGKVRYFPQMTKGVLRTKGSNHSKPETVGDITRHTSFNDEYYPKSILRFSNGDRTSRLHPTQKPVALFRYLIRTYTQPGDLVFDPCCGSGTTAAAAREEFRNYIVGDSSAEYIEVTNKRLSKPFNVPMFE